jgi:ankyrin repeat protein
MNRRRTTALLLAAMAGHAEIVETLLHRGVDPHQADESGVTALERARHGGHQAVVAVLMAAGAAPRTASVADLADAAAEGDVARLHALLAEGLAIDGVTKSLSGYGHQPHDDRGGKTALILAAERGHLAAVEALLAAGAQVATRGTTRMPSFPTTALATAAAHGQEAVVRRLVAAGARLSTREGVFFGAGAWSALHFAADQGHAGTVAALLEAGARPGWRAANGASPLHLAAAKGRTRSSACCSRPAPGSMVAMPIGKRP